MPDATLPSACSQAIRFAWWFIHTNSSQLASNFDHCRFRLLGAITRWMNDLSVPFRPRLPTAVELRKFPRKARRLLPLLPPREERAGERRAVPTPMKPLSPALSPSDGAREKAQCSAGHSLIQWQCREGIPPVGRDWERHAGKARFSLGGRCRSGGSGRLVPAESLLGTYLIPSVHLATRYPTPIRHLSDIWPIRVGCVKITHPGAPGVRVKATLRPPLGSGKNQSRGTV